MALVTSLSLAWVAWLRLGPAPAPEHPSPGSFPPPLRLIDLDDGEPVVILNRGKVAWLTFLSAREPNAPADLARLEQARAALRARRQFLPVLAVLDADTPASRREALAMARAGTPMYEAPPAVGRAYGVGTPPLHLLIGADGRVSAVARGWADATLERLARHAKGALDELEPPGRAHFARAELRPKNRVVRHAVKLPALRSRSVHFDSTRTRKPSAWQSAASSSRISPYATATWLLM